MALQRLEVCRKLHIITVVYYLSSTHKLASQYQPQDHSSTVSLHSLQNQDGGLVVSTKHENLESSRHP